MNHETFLAHVRDAIRNALDHDYTDEEIDIVVATSSEAGGRAWVTISEDFIYDVRYTAETGTTTIATYIKVVEE